ncbi:MAG TPA: 3'-5' exonuclease [Alcaligenes sp.]|nr:3'-5' exonuclease [Alcaligenes sp.]HRL25941.1 3'-5' exonuclease [Alcaligenes sp.]
MSVRAWWPWRRDSAVRGTQPDWTQIDTWMWQQAAFTVLDLETSGLDARCHHIVQIGAVRVERGAIALGNLWSGLVRQQGKGSNDSLLIHEISPSRQAAGQELEQVVQGFAAYAQNSLWMAWDADFDLAFLTPAWRAAGLSQPRPACLDLADLAECVLPNWQGRRRGLDDCLAYCGLPAIDRHDALGDALASAQLLQVLISRAQQQGLHAIGQARQAIRRNRQRRAAAF